MPRLGSRARHLGSLAARQLPIAVKHGDQRPLASFVLHCELCLSPAFLSLPCAASLIYGVSPLLDRVRSLATLEAQLLKSL